MTWEALLFIIAVFLVSALLFLMVYYVIMFSDLEADYINPIDLCEKLNQMVIPEVLLHFVLFGCLLSTLQWFPIVLNLPMVAWNVSKVVRRQHRFDPTEIFRNLPRHKRDALIKLGFYLLCFFYFLYRMILALVGGEEDVGVAHVGNPSTHDNMLWAVNE